MGVLAVVALAMPSQIGVAVAAGGPSSTTYTASLTAVEPAATTAGVPDVIGSARLVDGVKSNDVKLHMRNLAPKHDLSVA